MTNENPQLELQKRIIKEEYNDLECFDGLRKDAFNRAVRALSKARRGSVKRMVKEMGKEVPRNGKGGIGIGGNKSN